MRYVSTRGEAPVLGFSDALLTGLARDGGLYIPEKWPHFSKKEIRAMRGKTYQEIAHAVLSPFTGDEIASDDLKRMIDEAYATFRHPAVAPLVQSGPNSFILELFHGTTLAFKDVAMQLLARLMDNALASRDQRATIVGATSGDTGGAAIDAFGGRDRTDVFILFPHGKVSPVQQRQMTTTDHANVHAIAVRGTFDDCQNLVKATTSPSMDIQISSNFERLLFEVFDRDAGKVRAAMEGLKQSGSFEIEKKALAAISKDFRAGRVSESQVAKTIKSMFNETGYLLDPHSAIGVFTARKFEKSSTPMVTLATAHPAKFPLAVEKACGISPPLPSWLAGMMQREERFEVLDADIKTVEAFIAQHARIGN